MADGALWVEWRATTSGQGGVVLPDGCRDVILRGADPFFTAFDLRPRATGLPAGVRLHGFRLRPGVGLARGARLPEGGPGSVRRFLHENAIQDHGAAAIIDALSAGVESEALIGRSSAARRSLQRRFQRNGLPPPQVWRMLARARRAATMLATAQPLAEVALLAGYSDQAHLTRECRRWFGAPPSKLRRDADLLGTLAQPGLGNWTGEQISTRNPLGSLT